MVAIRIGETERALEHFRATACVDLLNGNHAVEGGTFIGRIHTAACGGTYQLAVNGFGGLDVRDAALVVDPKMPAAWSSISFPIRWRGRRMTVVATDAAVSISADVDNIDDVVVAVSDTDVTVAPGATVEIDVSRG